MPKVALILDGAEAARQRFADVGETFDRCCEMLRADGYSDFSFRVFTDEEVEFLLDGLDRREWASLVFASNALRSREVASAVSRQRTHLHSYLRSGGGLVVLHQIVESLAPLLPSELAPMVVERQTPPGAGAPHAHGEDVVLRYPLNIDTDALRDLRDDELQALRTGAHSSELPSLFFTAYPTDDLPRKLKPVLTASDSEVLMARTHEHVPERVVLTTIPLDWQGQRIRQHDQTIGLLANAIRYASLGEPRRLVWREPGTTTNELVRRWLCTDGKTAMRSIPNTNEPLPNVDKWLLSVVDVAFVPDNQDVSIRATPDVARYLGAGGTLIAVAAPGTGGLDPTVSQITTFVGRHGERTVTERLYAELRAIDGWATLRSAFALRDIVAALTFLWRDQINRQLPIAIDPSSLAEKLVPAIVERVGDPRHREDFGSSLALVQTLTMLTRPEPVSGETVDWVAADGQSREFDVALQTWATLAYAMATPARDFLEQALTDLRSQGERVHSLPPIVRLLHVIALLGEDDLLVAGDHAAVDIAVIVCDALDRVPALSERGWMSVDATASIVRGLVALRAHIPTAERVRARLAAHVATGVAALRVARNRYDVDAEGVAWLAHISHALILAERQFPLALQRLSSLPWPEIEHLTPPSKADRSLLEQLALENERLDIENRGLGEKLDTSTTKLAEEALSARLGRAIATLIPVVVLAALGVYVVGNIGWSSLTTLLANIAVLAGLILTLLAGAFTLLDRWHLLAAPAHSVRGWLEKQAVPLIKSASGVKTK